MQKKKKKSKIIPVCITVVIVLVIVDLLILVMGLRKNQASLEATDPATLDNQPTVSAVTTPQASTAPQEATAPQASTDATTAQGFHEIQPGEDISNIVVDVIQSPEYVDPDAGALDLDKIQGLSTPDSQSGSEDTEDQQGTVLSDPDLKVEAVAQYAGSFVEDGSNTPTVNVAAIVVTNNSSQMLQVGILEFQVNESETAQFKVTNLPAGASTLVLESSKRPFYAEDDYAYGKVAASYMDSPSLESDKFDFLEDDGKLTLVNKTSETYSKVYAYYKYVQLGGAYLGGITYRVPFENVPANGQVESTAGHFRPEGSKIIAVVIMPEE